MRKYLIAILLISFVLLNTIVFAQQETEPKEPVVRTEKSQRFENRLKIQGYTEYISFSAGDIEGNSWGGGILARYLFLDWFGQLGAQTNVTFYGASKEKKLGGDLSFANWRFSVILHTYDDTASPIYVYGGGGVGVQFNGDVGVVEVNNAFTGHVLAGIGYEITESFNIETEAGYQFGNANLKNYATPSASVNAFFIRFGGGIRF